MQDLICSNSEFWFSDSESHRDPEVDTWVALGSSFSSTWKQDLGVEGLLESVLYCELVCKHHQIIYETVSQGPPLSNKMQWFPLIHSKHLAHGLKPLIVLNPTYAMIFHAYIYL